MSKENKTNYKDIIELGFVEEVMDCSEFEKQHGIPWVVFTYTLSKYAYLDWDQITRECILVSTAKDGSSITSRSGALTLKEVKDILNVESLIKGKFLAVEFKPKKIEYDFSHVA